MSLFPINRNTVVPIAEHGRTLLARPGSNPVKAYQGFLRAFTGKGMVNQLFSFREGHTPAQLQALRDYAERVAIRLRLYSAEACAQYRGLSFDVNEGLVANHFLLRNSIETQDEEQLREMVKCVIDICESMEKFAENPDAALAPCPSGLSNDAQTKQLWDTSGNDVRGPLAVLNHLCPQDGVAA